MSRGPRLRSRAECLRSLLTLLAPVVLLLGPPRECAAAQRSLPIATPLEDAGAGPGIPVLPAGGRSVRISLEERRLYVLERGQVIWSARIGIGTGEQLEEAGKRWEFSTPTGRFRVQLKEREPAWVLPDWVFVKRGEPAPAPGSPKRRVEGALGAAALYLTDEIAIHGTDQPELLGNAISHGCIRMSDEDVLRLYEEMEVGALVIIH